jgi:prophage DNA circulation protein
MSTITDIHNPWRDALLPASFRGAHFHCEAGSRENGRRIVVHEFPKKELPYSEDMGRRAKNFTVRAYCISYPSTLTGQGLELYNRDYRVPRDFLLTALEIAGPGTLQLPTLPAENVVVTRYRLTEEERFGGYCVFDIEFAEFGVNPQYLTPSINTAAVLNGAADLVRQQAAAGMAPPGLAIPANPSADIPL